jgi:hypothetical protein
MQIRLHSCGISTGTYFGTNPYNLNPGLFKYNEAAVSLAPARAQARALPVSATPARGIDSLAMLAVGHPRLCHLRRRPVWS